MMVAIDVLLQAVQSDHNKSGHSTQACPSRSSPLHPPHATVGSFFSVF